MSPNTHTPGADWRAEAIARDNATAALGRLGRDWSESQDGRTYQNLSTSLILWNGRAEALGITRSPRLAVTLTVGDGLARDYPTAQDAISQARLHLGLPPAQNINPQENTMDPNDPNNRDTLRGLGEYLTERHPNTTFTARDGLLRVQRGAASVFHVSWDPSSGVWRVEDKLSDPHASAAYTQLATVCEDAVRRHREPVPAVPAPVVADEDVEALAAFGAELLRHNGGLRFGVSAVTVKGPYLRVESGASCPLELTWLDDTTWSARWREDEEDFEDLGDAISWLRAQTSWVSDPPASDLCELATDVSELCEELVALLDRKNKAYGDSARKPLAVFSKLPAIDRLAVRIDDKLSRIARAPEDAKAAVPEDTVLDLIGYLAIYLVETRKASN